MKNGKCPKCNSTKVYFKEYALDALTLDGKRVENISYICTDCGYVETYVTDKDALGKIPVRAEKLGDWKKAK
jgi:predicted nucleic-acid-binding Zn-ribbon protein